MHLIFFFNMKKTQKEYNVVKNCSFPVMLVIQVFFNNKFDSKVRRDGTMQCVRLRFPTRSQVKDECIW